MQKLLLLSCLAALALNACGGIQATVGRDPGQKAAQPIVEKWIAAYHQRDAAALLSLYSPHMTWRSCTGPACDAFPLSALQASLPGDLANPAFVVKVQSYFLTASGYKAVVQSRLSDPKIPVKDVPAVAILEINPDGTIYAETWYWAGP